MSTITEVTESTQTTLRVHALITSLTWGGAEMLLSDFAAAAPTAGIQVSVGYLEEKQGSPGAVRLRRHGIEPTLAAIASGHPLISPTDYLNVRRHIASIRPDVVHTHLGYADALGGVAAASLGIPAVCTLHESHWLKQQGRVRDRARDRLIALARHRCMARVIAVSDAARSAYLNLGWEDPERVVTIHNGIYAQPQPKAGRAVREQLGLQPDDVVIAILSVLRVEKGHGVAIEAARALRERFPNLKLMIVGEGRDRAQIESLAATLPSGVVMAGHREDVMAVLDAADVLVHPTSGDAFPTALIEAMAAGLPTVATAVGGVPEIVEAGVTGFMIEPPPRAEQLAAALLPLLEHKETRSEMGLRARERFEREFTAEAWAQRLRAVYVSALSDRIRAHRQPNRRRQSPARRVDDLSE
jgi:glycosyltransferase involved in cell wall biosynthesis